MIRGSSVRIFLPRGSSDALLVGVAALDIAALELDKLTRSP